MPDPAESTRIAGTTPTPDKVRSAVETFCDHNWDPDTEVRRWWALLATSGYAAPMLPVEAGGRGYGRDLAAVVSATLAERKVLGPPAGLGLMLAAPSIVIHGTETQIDRFVPEILDGSVGWCQLFSEPNAGSDLAGLQCRAERDGDEWVITGQKVWTSGGQVADMGMLVARTDPEAPKHKGISWFAFSMDQPGVEVRPLTEMTGRALFNEVFIDEARVANDDLIGDPGNGWAVANTTLMIERASLGSSGRRPASAVPGPKGGVLSQRCGDYATSGSSLTTMPEPGMELWWHLVELARKTGRISDRVLRNDLMSLYSLIEINKLSMRRAKAASQVTGAEPNIAKLIMSELARSFRDTGLRVLGPDGMLSGASDEQSGGVLAEVALFSPAPSIYGGTDQIQRNIIGERVLGLAREPGPDRNMPFSRLPKN